MRVFKNTYDSIEDQLNKVEHFLIFGCISFSFFWLLPLLEWQWDLSLVSLLDSLFASSLASRKEMSPWMSPCPYKWQGCRDPMLELWQPMLPKMQRATIRCSMQPKLQLHFPPGPRKQIQVLKRSNTLASLQPRIVQICQHTADAWGIKLSYF